MAFEKLLEGIHIIQELKRPSRKLVSIAREQCKKLRLDYNLNSIQLKFTTEVETSLNCDECDVGAHLRYTEIDDNCFEVEVAVPKQINSLLELYLLSHEIGHFLKGHLDYILKDKEKPLRDPFDVEVEADEWAVQFFYDTGLERTKEIEEAILKNLKRWAKPGEKRKFIFKIK